MKDVLGYEPGIQIHEGIVEIKQALERGVIRGEDPRFYTLQWYMSLMEWEKRYPPSAGTAGYSKFNACIRTQSTFLPGRASI